MQARAAREAGILSVRIAGRARTRETTNLSNCFLYLLILMIIRRRSSIKLIML
jgi:hypothetical protein